MRRIDLSHAPRVRRLGNEADPEVLGSSGDQMKYDLMQQDEVLFTSYQKKMEGGGGRKEGVGRINGCFSLSKCTVPEVEQPTEGLCAARPSWQRRKALS